MLLRLVSAHYEAIDEERRGIVQSMRLMADEARAMAHEAREQSSEHLQVILDHIKDVVLTVDEDGVIQTFNPTGERVFGHAEAEVVGQRIDLLIPKIATHETITQALYRLAASTGDTAIDLASRESWGQRKDGEFFPAEIAVSKARLSRREVFVLCLRDITDRRESEQAMRESEARYRLLVNHAPEAIVVFDVDAGRFVDVNENAERFFGLDRARLLQVGPVDLSPPLQPDGTPSAERVRDYVQRALEGEPQVHEWMHRDSFGKDLICEVRLVRMPSGNKRLVRGTIADISDRKRTERVAAAEREVFEQLTSNAPLEEVLASITRLIESVGVGTVCSVSMLADDGPAFASMVAPRLPENLRAVLERSAIDIRNGSCAAAVYLGRQVLVADVARIPSGNSAAMRRWNPGCARPGPRLSKRRAASFSARSVSIAVSPACPATRVATSWRMPRNSRESPSSAAWRSRRCAAVRPSSAACLKASPRASTRARRDGRLLSVNPAFVSILGYGSAEELYALPSVAMLYWNPADRAEFMRRVESEGEIRNAEFQDAEEGRSAGRDSRERTRRARCRRTDHRL